MSQRKFFSVMVMAQRDAFADEHNFSALLDVLLANPLAAIAQMDLSGQFQFDAALDRAAVGRALTAGDRGPTPVWLAAAERKQLWLSLARFHDRCALNLTFAAELVPAVVPVAELIAFCEAIWGAMPARSHAAVKPDTEYQDTMQAADLSFVDPLFFGHVGWLHWLDPVGYAQWYERDDLLRAPLFRAEVRPFEAVFMQAYEDPWQYSEPDTLARLQAVAEHLERTRKTGGIRMSR